LCISEEVLAEYSEVFSRPKFAALDRRSVARLLAAIAGEATWLARQIGWLNP